MRRRVKPTSPSPDRWMVSYADFITLLFAFFVVLFAAADSDAKKAAQIAQAVQGAFKHQSVGRAATAVSTDVSVKVQLQEVLKDEIDKNLIHIVQDSRGITIS